MWCKLCEMAAGTSTSPQGRDQPVRVIVDVGVAAAVAVVVVVAAAVFFGTPLECFTLPSTHCTHTRFALS
jgi:hypothetical protein